MNETDALAAWLKTYQGLSTADGIAALSNFTRGNNAVIQEKLGRLQLETEPASFEGLLHQLAPEALKGE